MGNRYFTPQLFAFLRELAAHNDREWFAAHQQDYETHARRPALRFIADAAPLLAGVSAQFVADDRKVGGSLLRIQRDTRFTPDKTPYRSYLGIHFRHRQWRERHTPGIYLALRPRGSYLGIGSWRPDGATSAAIRRAIVDRPEAWEEATGPETLGEALALAGDELKRPPRGFDRDHRLIADLRRKYFAAAAPLTQRVITSDQFVDHFGACCRRARPLVEFLCRAVGVPF